MHVYIDTAPLHTGHAHRGIGLYTRELIAALSEQPDLSILTEPADKNTADVVHYPYFDLFFPTLPLRLARKQPLVVTIHDVIPLEFPDEYKPGVRGSLMLHRQKLALASVAAIITDSEYSKQTIVRLLGQPQEKLYVVPLAANPALQKPTPQTITTIAKQYKLPQHYMLYVGDINYNKNIPQLIKSLKFLPDTISLVCVGKNFVPQDIPEWKWIETQIALSDVAARVHFLADIPTDQPEVLAAVYAGAVAYVQPSLSEGFGLPVLEALHCGCPVVVSDRGSLPEVGGSVVLYVEPTAERIAMAVESIQLWSREKRTRVRELGQVWASQFRWQTTAQKTRAVYEEVLR